MALSPLAERLIAALTTCPCCSAPLRRERRRDAGIPEHCVYEAVFECGALVFVMSLYEYELGRGCTRRLDLALDALQDRVTAEVYADA